MCEFYNDRPIWYFLKVTIILYATHSIDGLEVKVKGVTNTEPESSECNYLLL
jgi:hypothetical protein